jgi:short-subunit dehydrogenase
MPPDDDNASPGAVLRRVAEEVWILDAEPIHRAGLPLPIRMTVIRLANGHLLLHSPTRYAPAIGRQLDALGPVRHLIAPSFGHWMFVQEWQAAYPQAASWAAPGVGRRPQVRAAGVHFDHELGEESPAAWAGEIDQVVVRAGPFAEVEFFHRASRTLVLTDLVIRLEPDQMPAPWRAPARALGVTQPEGGAPAYLRAVLHANRTPVAAAAARLVALAPERVIFAHGRWFEDDGQRRLRDALSWLSASATREFAGRTVVVTGASSGIGRATAQAFAQRGAQLVLAARREDVLQEVADVCEALGGQAIAVPTDVTDPDAVQRLVEAAEDRFGRIDIWINNAGVGVFGPYQDTDLVLHRRTVEVNLMGTMHGAWAVIPRFIRQGEGTLINNISLGAWSPTPFAAAYTASKFGLRGFTASLRQELAPHPAIHVCGVFPAIVDTPGFVHGANTSGLDLDPGPLLYRAEDVAGVIVNLARRPRAEVVVGWPAAAAKLSYAAAPRLTERVMNRAMRAALSKAQPAPSTDGALLEPIAAGVATSGGWLRRRNLPSASVLSTAAAACGLALVAAAIGIRTMAGHRRR